MTRKDYVALAGAIRPNHKIDSTWALGVRLVAYDIANVLAADNPRFDRERFLDAALGDDRPRATPTAGTVTVNA